MKQPLTKAQIRNDIKTKRRALTTEEQHQNATQLLSVLKDSPEFLQCHSIAAYWPSEGEIDPRPILELAISQGKKCLLPVLDPTGKKELLFYEYNSNTVLIKNRFGILEPSALEGEPITASLLELVLVPVVAFTRKGQRLGRGAGFYDRTFSFLKEATNPIPYPKLIGLAYEFQHYDSLPKEVWDVPLYGIATEKQFIRIELLD